MQLLERKPVLMGLGALKGLFPFRHQIENSSFLPAAELVGKILQLYPFEILVNIVIYVVITASKRKYSRSMSWLADNRSQAGALIS